MSGRLQRGWTAAAILRRAAAGVFAVGVLTATLPGGSALTAAEAQNAPPLEHAKQLINEHFTSWIWPFKRKVKLIPMDGSPAGTREFAIRTEDSQPDTYCVATSDKAYCEETSGAFEHFLKDYQYIEKQNLDDAQLISVVKLLGLPRGALIILNLETGLAEHYPDVKPPLVTRSKDGVTLTFYLQSRQQRNPAKWTVTLSPDYRVTVDKSPPLQPVVSAEERLVAADIEKRGIKLRDVEVLPFSKIAQLPPGARVFYMDWVGVMDVRGDIYIVSNGRAYCGVKGSAPSNQRPGEFERFLKDHNYLEKPEWTADQLAYIFAQLGAPSLAVVGFPPQTEFDKGYEKSYLAKYPEVKPPSVTQSKDGLTLTFYAYPIIMLSSADAPSKWTVTVTPGYRLATHTDEPLKPKP